MMCYKDKTFCDFFDCENFKNCHRALTEEVVESANKLNMPICRFVHTNLGDKPECFV